MKLPDDIAEEMSQAIRKIERELPDHYGFVMLFFPYDGREIDGEGLCLSNVPPAHLRAFFTNEQFLDQFQLKEEMT